MWSSRQRNEVVRLFGRRLLLGALVLVAIALFSGVWSVARKERESAQMKRDAQGQLAELKMRQEQLSSTVKKLESNRGKEGALREQYALAAVGEKMIVIIDPATPTPAKATSSPSWITRMFGWW